MENNTLKVRITTPTEKEREEFDKKYPQFKCIIENQPKLTDKEMKKIFKRYGRGGYKKKNYLVSWKMKLTWFDKILRYFDFNKEIEIKDFSYQDMIKFAGYCRQHKSLKLRTAILKWIKNNKKI